MWTASLSQKTEVKQIGLDFPMLHRQSACCEAALWITFDPRNSLIRMGQCVHMLLLVDPTINLLLSFIYFFPLLSFTDLMSRNICYLFLAAVCYGSFLSLTQWNCGFLCFFFLLTIQTPQPPHAAFATNVDHHVWPTPLILYCFVITLFRCESMCAKDQCNPATEWCSHSTVAVLLCLWPLFISAWWLLGPHGFTIAY